MSKLEAQQVTEWLESADNTPEYIVLYKSISLPWVEPPKLIYSYSAKLAPYLRDYKDKTLDKAAYFDGKRITFKDKTFSAREIPADWGSQILVYFNKKDNFSLADTILKFTNWHNKLSKGVRALVGVAMSISLTIISFAEEIRNLFPPILPSKEVSQADAREKLKDILRLSYYKLPNPQANGLFYWQYSDNCDRRYLVEGFTPFPLLTEEIGKIQMRSTTELGWGKIVVAHKKGEMVFIRRSELKPENALYQAMLAVGTKEIVAVPVPPQVSPCPTGYLSVGTSSELTDDQRTRYSEALKTISISVNSWGRLAQD